ncbi:hypothetical protein D9M72_483380 [compost metagenome]
MVGGVAFDLLADVGRLQRVVVGEPGSVENVDVRQVVQQQRIGSDQFDIDGVVVHLLRRLVGGEIATQRRHRIADPSERGDHVVRGEIGAIVELDALAQMKPPDRV